MREGTAHSSLTLRQDISSREQHFKTSISSGEHFKRQTCQNQVKYGLVSWRDTARSKGEDIAVLHSLWYSSSIHPTTVKISCGGRWGERGGWGRIGYGGGGWGVSGTESIQTVSHHCRSKMSILKTNLNLDYAEYGMFVRWINIVDCNCHHWLKQGKL